jgi:group II intron reverse transcriptase/maturase
MDTAETIFTLHALRRAWQEVRRGGAMPGTDRVTLEQFASALDAELNRLRHHLLTGVYQAHPVRRFFIRKASGKQRPIAVWTVRDRVVQRVVHDYLTPPFEAIFLPCSYGFRPGRTIAGAAAAVVAARDAGQTWVLDADVADCFGSIPVAPLQGQVARVIASPVINNLIDMWLHTPVAGSAGAIAGVSQGGIISPQLANLYLHRFDEMLTAALPRAVLVRFADDFIVLSDSEDAAAWSLDVARRSLENLHLRLNMRKTRIVNFEEGFTFLGATFKGRWFRLADGAESNGG